MPIPEQLPEQIHLALEIVLGLKGEGIKLKNEELQLLKIEELPSSQETIKSAVLDVLYETLIFLLSQKDEGEVIDLREVAVELLNRIKEDGGSIRRDKVGLPEELIAQLEQEGVVRRTVHGLIWGPRAKQAIEVVKKEKNKS